MSMKTFTAAGAFGLGLLASFALGCAVAGDGHDHGAHEHASAAGGGEHDHETPTAQYSCPMGCEGDKTYAAPGRCPKCGMALVAGDSDDDPTRDHASHDHGSSDHMAHMNEVRAWLRAELGGSYDKPVPAATSSQLRRGGEIYSSLCSVCHGPSGKGDGPAAVGLPSRPADFTDRAHSSYYSDRGRLHIIRNGVPETPMVGWAHSLSEAEILSVHAYVRSLRGGPQPDPTRDPLARARSRLGGSQGHGTPGHEH